MTGLLVAELPQPQQAHASETVFDGTVAAPGLVERPADTKPGRIKREWPGPTETLRLRER